MSVQPRAVNLAEDEPFALPAWFFPVEHAEATIVAMAALGVSARFYRPLAEALTAAGMNVLLLEQRGHGDSPVRPGFRSNWGFREPLLGEVRRGVAWARERDGALPVYLLGHSLGGHYANMTVGLEPHSVDGVILVACATPWVEAFSGATRAKIKLLHVLIPTVSRVLGHYPGDRIGFGGREARGLMLDWLAFSKTNRYGAAGIDHDFDAGIAKYRGPVLVVRMAEDDFAPAEAVEAVTRKFAAARVTSRVLDERALGTKADHFRWARKPSAIVGEIARWHETNRAARVIA